MMGAGKTTVGRAVAARTGWPYLDNDDLVKRAAGRPAPEVLAARVEDGEGRPWLAEDPAGALARLSEGRDALYDAVADVVLDVADESPDALAGRIVDAVAG